MEEKRPAWPLEEPQNPWVKSMVLGGIVAVAAYSLVAMIGADDLSWESVGMVLVVVAVTSVLLLLLLWFVNRARLVLDDQGVLMKHIIAAPHTLDWKQVRTAAIVKLSNDPRYCWIVLSTNPNPADVLVRKRLVWKNAKRGEAVRIPYTARRQEVVGHYLHMTLPEIKL